MTTFTHPISLRPKRLRANCVAELMTVRPLAFEERLPISTALALLQLSGLEAAPIVAEDGRLVGVVNRESFAAWKEFSLRSSPCRPLWEEPDMAPVWLISCPAVESIRDEAPVREIMHRLFRGSARRIYVVDREDRLVGVTSLTDLFRGLLEYDHPEKVA